MKHTLYYLLTFTVLFSSCYSDESAYPDMEYSADFGPAVGDKYNEYEENPFVNVGDQPVSTFSIDADGGSYSNIRRFIRENQEVPKAAVRTEELINYFVYDYPDPTEKAIGINGEISQCPWTPANKLVRIGIKGKNQERDELPAANIVLLIDVSGSMSDESKLGLLKKAFIEMVEVLRPQDKIAIVTYAGEAGLLLDATPGSEKQKIVGKINSLGSGGSTAGAQGIITAYEIAKKNFVDGGNNRVIIGSDGDFNVGVSSQEELVNLIEEKRDEGIFLTVVGVGRGNLNDAMMEQLANHGNGTYEYLDNFDQAQKIFVEEFEKFYTIAKDVKVQVEFNPQIVKAYRLIGYENRLLETEDFEDDTKDAGEIGIGQTITALYEIVPAEATPSDVLSTFTIDFRYKEPYSETSQELSLDIFDTGRTFEQATENMRFAASLAGFGMYLRDSEYKGELSLQDLRQWASGAKEFDPYGYRAQHLELLELVE